jgi:hypothetical protein
MRTVILAVIAGLLPAACLAQPRIEFSPDRLDFGRLQEWESREAAVTIRNTGDQVLRIRDVESTCGCAVPELPVRELAPGAGTTMQVHFSSKTFQGPQIRYLHIYSNDPVRGSFEFLVTADIMVPLYMSPSETTLRFPTVKIGESHSLSYSFRTEDVPRLEIEPQTWPRQWLDIKVHQGDGPQSARVEFSIRPEGAAGRYRDTVRLATNVPGAPTVDLEVDVRLVADLVLGMDRVNLGVVTPHRPLQTKVRVTPHQRGTAFKLTRAEIDIPGLRASIENGNGESFAVLEGEAIAKDHPLATQNQGRIQGTLRIFSDLKTTPELQVPVTYMLRL